jgi:hypothetical protein
MEGTMIVLALMLAAQAEPQAPARDPRLDAVEQAIRASLRDPDSAKFSWPYGFAQGTYRSMWGRKTAGELICGTVNAKNGFGGYTGPYAAIGVVSGGAVVLTDIDSPGRWSAKAGWVADQCRKAGQPLF